MASPLDQFQIKPIVPIEIAGLNLAFTNSALWMTLAVAAATFFLVSAASGARIVPGRMQSAAEVLYEFIAGMVRENVGDEGKRYFPFFFTLFMFVLFGNLAGMIPGSFTFTSHIVVTFTMALIIF
ncbi:MAG: F0F1 ATP synthase subunit A, partial [Tagaea sp.]